ncbi:uncharacterized protein LOC134283962 isoform X1 [Aedes albopictus]|uniref:FLYWCH-type domain-containing protein n=1 Tax=Aedes albopictus TaxID=7160 RepID=A0ABM1YIU1_AEDAL
MFIVSRKGGILLVHESHIYRSNMRRQGPHKNILYWECVHNRSQKCRGRLKSEGNYLFISNTNVQEMSPTCDAPQYVISKCGTVQLRHNGHLFNRHVKRDDITYWRCSQFTVYKCRARIKSVLEEFFMLNVEHNHQVVASPRAYGSLKRLKQQLARY